MSIEYPATWASLQFPSYRAELIEHLKDVVGTPPGSDPTYDEFHIDAIVEFLFDLTDLSELGGYSPGEVLFDATEEALVVSVASTLDSIIRELGDAPTRTYLTHYRWPEVQRHANRALREISERGVPVYGP